MSTEPRPSRAAGGAAGALRVVSLLAAAGAALVFVVIVSSAYLRHQQAGLGCADRASCYRPPVVVAQGSALPDGTTGGGAWSAAARLTHRLSATAVTAAIAGIVLVGWAARPMPKGIVPPTLGLLTVATVLAVIGTTAMQSNLPIVTLVNLVGGMVMFALFARILASSTIDPAPATSSVRWPPAPASASASASQARRVAAAAGVLAVLLLAQIALGGLVSAQFAGLACGADWLCRGGFAADWALADWSALSVPTSPAERAAGQAAAMAALNLAHRVGGVAIVLASLLLAWRLGRAGPAGRALVATAALALFQAAIGVFNVAASLPLAGVLVHNAVPALMLFLASWASARASHAAATA